MPATRKRIRPVIEEIIEAPTVEPEAPQVHEHHHSPVKEEVVENTPQEVAQYDEPPALEKVAVVPSPEHAARNFLEAEETRRSGPNLKLMFGVTIITALLVGFIAGGVYVYMSGVSGSKELAQASPTPSPLAMDVSPTPSPTPEPSVVPSSFSVSVLNGSGVIGAAGKVKSALESGGFKVTGTGNATNYNFKNTVLQTKASVSSAAVELLKKSLKDYVVEEGDPLPASSTFDVIVTTGKQ